MKSLVSRSMHMVTVTMTILLPQTQHKHGGATKYQVHMDTFCKVERENKPSASTTLLLYFAPPLPWGLSAKACYNATSGSADSAASILPASSLKFQASTPQTSSWLIVALCVHLSRDGFQYNGKAVSSWEKTRRNLKVGMPVAPQLNNTSLF